MQLAYESRTVTTPEELLDVLADIADDHDITCKWVEDHDYIDHMAEEMATTTIKRKQKLSAWLREFRGNLPVVYGVPVTDTPTPEPSEDPLEARVARLEATARDTQAQAEAWIAETTKRLNAWEAEIGTHHKRQEQQVAGMLERLNALSERIETHTHDEIDLEQPGRLAPKATLDIAQPADVGGEDAEYEEIYRQARELSQASGKTVTRAVYSLTKAGLVPRRVDPEDMDLHASVQSILDQQVWSDLKSADELTTEVLATIAEYQNGSDR